MRSDFQKLLCECYKECRGSASSSGNIRRRKKRLQDNEDTCSSVYISNKKLNISTKYFGENLAPLRRFIEKQVGRPWDKVYSEICRHNSKAGAVGLHIFQHLYSYIETDTVKDQHNRIFNKPGSEHHWYAHGEEISFGTLYVDPDDNIIKRYRRNKRQQKSVPVEQVIQIDENTSIRQDKGIWYRYTWKETPRIAHRRQGKHGLHTYYAAVFCLYQKKNIRYPEDCIYAEQKFQLNQRELKQYNLSNQ